MVGASANRGELADKETQPHQIDPTDCSCEEQSVFALARDGELELVKAGALEVSILSLLAQLP